MLNFYCRIVKIIIRKYICSLTESGQLQDSEQWFSDSPDHPNPWKTYWSIDCWAPLSAPCWIWVIRRAGDFSFLTGGSQIMPVPACCPSGPHPRLSDLENSVPDYCAMHAQ